MPKTPVGKQITSAALEFAAQISAIVQENIAREVARVLSESHGLKTKNGDSARSKRRYPEHCLFPRCDSPHKGPRFSFLCAKHLNIGKAEKKKLVAGWQQNLRNGSSQG